MPRQANPTPPPATTAAQLAATAPAFQAMAAAVDANMERANALAVTLAYEGEMTIAALLDGIRFYQRRTVEDCLELGKRLLLLQEIVPRGEWLASLPKLGFAERTAQRFMEAAFRTAKSAIMADMSRRTDSVAKMLEFLTMEDDEAGTLLSGGTVAGLKLDQFEAMTASEMRAALRAAREDSTAKDRVLADKSATIDRQATEIAKLKNNRQAQAAPAYPDPDRTRAELLAEVNRLVLHAEHTIAGNLNVAFAALLDHIEESGGPQVHDLLAGALGQIATALDELRHLFGIGAAPAGQLPTSQLWDAIAAEAAMTPAERAAAERATADHRLGILRASGWDEAAIRRDWPGLLAASSEVDLPLGHRPALEPTAGAAE